MKPIDVRPQSLEEENLEFDFSGPNADPGPAFPLHRREFLKLVGGGIFIFCASPRVLDGQEGRRPGREDRELPEDFNAFLRIGEDGTVTGFTGKIEMGQGVVTSLAQMLAEELEVSLDSVRMVMGDTGLCPWDRGTFGSMTTRFFGPPFRAAAAEAKAVLLELASQRLGLPRERLKIKDGAVSEVGGAKTISYAELARGRKILRHVKGARPESAAGFTIMAKPVLRRDSRDKVTGRARFAGDMREPGMLCARILRPPAHGARLISVDTSGALEIEGAQVVRDGDLIAVLHSEPEAAARALAKIKTQFEPSGFSADDKTIFDHLLKVAPAGRVIAEGGKPSDGEEASEYRVDATYLNSYVAHAPMEPHTALAKVEGSKLTIWASTQTPFPLRDAAASLLGMAPDNVRVITPFVGGGFGGKSNIRQALEAARLAKLTGKPVQVAWTRAEEFFYDTFRPAAVVKIKAGMRKSGLITFWDYSVYFAGERGSEQFYEIPNHRTMAYGSGWGASEGAHPFGTGPWRAPANNTNSFARESHIDMLAAKAGLDPVEFRLKNLKNERMRRVLQAVAEKSGWSPARAPSGRGYGVACGIDVGTCVAHMAEVAVDKSTGKIVVKRVVCAQEMGLCVNPEGATIQMEGCMMMGLGYALSEQIRFTGGKIHDVNFGTYSIPRFSWLPQIETLIVDAKDSPAQGGGEPAIICMGAVIANAVFDATGIRLLQLPLTPERVKDALARA
ncbi:MAG TPA: molybdopterin cofactor-binding domain-containing protein [Terriglobia bacterium]|nr:molybdopterin cofactor-binding domain-containing protein [Terriglobia bacterium]